MCSHARVAIFGRKTGIDRRLATAIERGAQLPEWDRRIIACCRARLQLFVGDPSAGDLRLVDSDMVMLLTRSSLVLPTLTGAWAFPIGGFTLGREGEFRVMFKVGGSFYLAHAYSGRELAAFVRAFDAVSPQVPNPAVQGAASLRQVRQKGP